MRKQRQTLGELTMECRTALEQWLFDDVPALNYPQARVRLQQEFQVETSVSALCRFYQRRARERMLARLVNDGHAGNTVWGHIGQQPEQPFKALLEVVGRSAFDIPANGVEPLSLDELKDLGAVAVLGLKAHTEVVRLKIRMREAAAKERQAEATDRAVTLKETIYRDLIEKQNTPSESKAMTTEELRHMVEAAHFM